MLACVAAGPDVQGDEHRDPRAVSADRHLRKPAIEKHVRMSRVSKIATAPRVESLVQVADQA